MSPAVSPCTAPARGRRRSLSQGASWEGGEEWKNVFKTPLAHELSPVWGVSSLPAPAGVVRPCGAAGRRRRGNVAFGNWTWSGSGAECLAGAPQCSPLLWDCPTLMENPRGEGTKRGELLGERGEEEAGKPGWGAAGFGVTSQPAVPSPPARSPPRQPEPGSTWGAAPPGCPRPHLGPLSVSEQVWMPLPKPPPMNSPFQTM